MPSSRDYSQKFEAFKNKTPYGHLDRAQQDFVRCLAFTHHLTFQEFRQVVEASRDLSMWGEGTLEDWWNAQTAPVGANEVVSKQRRLGDLQNHMLRLRQAPKRYPPDGLARPKKREKNRVITEKSDKKIHGRCPVASEKTVCCNLYTIDAVENCIFGCSYCSIQTFYGDQIVFDDEFAQKLKAIPVAPERFYHFGTGQSSDALVWGNRNGILDALCEFARNHPNLLLELKTKSDNIRYFLEREAPRNLVCSWSLNTPTIIDNEEHFTASLDQRIQAARRVADKGVKVAFHFHPIVYYQGWESDYPEIAATLMEQFAPEEVLFLSFGSVTLIKPVIQKIRTLGYPTKILQMEMVADPHGKLTYPDAVKISMFKTMMECFQPWRDRVFMYLCMEKASIWENTFGYVYQNNEEFEEDFGVKTRWKLAPPGTSQTRKVFTREM